MNPTLLYLLLGFCAHSIQATEFVWKPVESSRTATGISVTGRVVPEDGALVIESARVQGRVLSILKREGESVMIGDALYSISSSECSALAEETRLAAKRNIPELIAGTTKREHQLGLKLDGEQCRTVANHSGVLTKRYLESGASFNVGDPLTTVLDTHHLMIELDIPERDYGRVHTGAKVTFQFASNPDKKLTSYIRTIVPTIDPVTRSVKARLNPINLPRNASLDALIFGEVGSGKGETALKVPATALVFHHNEQYVITGTEAKPKAVAVQILSESTESVSIRPTHDQDLKLGDSVLIKGAIFVFQKLKNEG